MDLMRGQSFPSLKEARGCYNVMVSDEWDGVHLVKKTVETTVITTYTSMQSK